MSEAVLADLRVLDLTTYVPGPYASLLLADLGARVVHVEPPGGDPARHLPDRAGDDSALHAWLGRGKQHLVLDLKSDAGRRACLDLARTCDVVLEGFRPGVAARLGVDEAGCRAVNPRIVYCSITGYGSTGPHAATPAHDLNAAARAGLLDQIRDGDGRPVPVGPLLADMAGALHAAVAVLAALRHRDRTGVGGRADVSLFASALALGGSQLVKALAGNPPRPGRDLNLGGDPGYQVYETRDGRWISLGALEDGFWRRLCTVLDRPDLVTARADDPERVRRELTALFASADRAEWDARLEAAGVCYAPVNALDEVPADPYLRPGDLVAGAPGCPVRLTPAPAAPTAPAAPVGA